MTDVMDIEQAKSRARKGASMLFARRLVVILVTFVSTVTIARLVPPQAYGLANMSSVLLALAMVFRDFGLTNAMMRKAQINDDELSFLFWVNAGVTAVMTLLLAVAAPSIATFYREPIVLWVVLISLIGFFASGVTLQHVALMNRNLRFGTVAIIDVAALLVGFATSLTLAIIRHDVWAIVIGTVAQLLTSAILFTVASGWRPGAPRRPEDLGSLVRFGFNTSLYSLSTFLSNNAIVILIGHYLGASALGQFNRAQALFQLPAANIVQPIVQATMPLLTRLSGHPEEYRAAYLRLVRQLCVILFPMAVALTFAARPLVEALLGPAWTEAGQVLTALAPTLAAFVFGYAAGDLFITQNRSAELRTLGLIELVVRVGAVVGLMWYGLVPAALGFTAATFAASLLRMIVAGARGPVSRVDQLRSAAPGLPLAAGALFGCLVVFYLTPDGWQSTARAATLLAAGAAGALAFAMAFGASRRALGELFDAVGVLRIYGVIQRRLRPVPSAGDDVS